MCLDQNMIFPIEEFNSSMFDLASVFRSKYDFGFFSLLLAFTAKEK